MYQYRDQAASSNGTNLSAMAAWPFARSKLARRATLEYCKVRADADRDRESASVTKKLESCMLSLDYLNSNMVEIGWKSKECVRKTEGDTRPKGIVRMRGRRGRRDKKQSDDEENK